MTEIRIGTSGWHYRHWVGRFYPPKIRSGDMLPFYFERFDTVEINNSFYRLPSPETFAAWRRDTPPDFTFAVKGSRYLTHMKKLKEPEEGIARFEASVRELGEKLGVVLFQLPPHWTLNLDRLEYFLASLPPGPRYTFEFREPSWLVPAVYRLLESYNAAFCIYELAGFQSPLELTADFTYIRLHGPSLFKYQGSYPEATLRKWARRILQWRELTAAYVYFDNDDSAYAVDNALTLRRIVRESIARPARERRIAAP